MSKLNDHSLEYLSHNPDQTRGIGLRLGGLLQQGDVICLEGELGAGKTTLVQGLAKGWGSLDPVTSPTFLIVNSYRRPDNGLLYHMDAYRLESALEAAELDLDEMLSQGCLVVEWPERIKEILPKSSMWICLEYIAEEDRQMVIKSLGERYNEMLGKLRKELYGGR